MGRLLYFLLKTAHGVLQNLMVKNSAVGGLLVNDSHQRHAPDKWKELF
jgi:hypothetical protein